MKANELMIGDWVLDGNVCAQITSITCGGNIETTHSEHSNIELVKPIPITPEILEKNGLVKAENPRTGTIMYSFRDFLFRIEVYDFEHVIVVSVYTDSMYEGFISGVHELQHALRLCGINKEIIV